MKSTTVLYVMVAAAAFAGNAEAVYKCTTAKGVVYQDRPCREGSEMDVLIVVPTGEPAPKSSASAGEALAASNPRQNDRAGALRVQRNVGDPPATAAKPVERRAADPATNGADAPRRKDVSASAESTVPPIPEQARKADPSAKYYATEAFGTGGETPSQMNCESPTGEKRVFYLTNGKLTSI